MKTERADTLNAKAKDITEELTKLRRQIHRTPELGFEEKMTARVICDKLKALGIKFRSGVGKTGVVGLIKGRGDGKTVCLRADMDALPVQEENEVPYASQKKGIMHACGHDAHVACLLGAANLLAPLREQFQGNIKLVFQPAEEIDQGARAVLSDGGFESPRPDAIFGLHVNPELPVGSIGLREGPLMAAIDTIRISMKGKGGHGAMPHKCIDAVVAASALVMNLQTAVSREVDPIQPTVISIGTFHGGQAENTIASQADLTGTVRTLDPKMRQSLPDIVERICQNTAASFGAKVSLDYQQLTPLLVNSPEMVDKVAEASTACLGAKSLVEAPISMVGDDFAFYLKEVPGAYFYLGARNVNEVHALHSSCFDIDESALPLGAAILAYTALLMLEIS